MVHSFSTEKKSGWMAVQKRRCHNCTIPTLRMFFMSAFRFLISPNFTALYVQVKLPTSTLYLPFIRFSLCPDSFCCCEIGRPCYVSTKPTTKEHPTRCTFHHLIIFNLQHEEEEVQHRRISVRVQPLSCISVTQNVY
jgi:hypothetical protein